MRLKSMLTRMPDKLPNKAFVLGTRAVAEPDRRKTLPPMGGPKALATTTCGTPTKR